MKRKSFITNLGKWRHKSYGTRVFRTPDLVPLQNLPKGEKNFIFIQVLELKSQSNITVIPLPLEQHSAIITEFRESDDNGTSCPRSYSNNNEQTTEAILKMSFINKCLKPWQSCPNPKLWPEENSMADLMRLFPSNQSCLIEKRRPMYTVNDLGGIRTLLRVTRM